MLETLLMLLKLDCPAPEILLEEDGELCLDWRDLTVSITPTGKVSWAHLSPTEHGTDIDRLIEILKTVT